MSKLSTNVTVIITGVAGFCGSKLAQILINCDQRVIGIEVPQASTEDLTKILDRVELRWADLREVQQVYQVLGDTHPDYIYHLAGLTKSQEENCQSLYEVNVQGTINLLETVRAHKLDCSLLITGSSAQYGLVTPDENPIHETCLFYPITHYGVSKAAQEMVGYRYWAADGLHIIRTRAFNLTGPGESARFVTSTFARQIAEIEAGMREPVLNVGNLDAVRDFTDVRDAVRAYQLLAASGESGEVYNVCSGQGTSIREILNGLLALSVADDITVRVDPARFQPADVPIQVGDASKLRALTGWTPAIPLRQTLEDVLNYWRKKVKEESI